MRKIIISGIPSRTVIIGKGKGIVTIDDVVENLFSFEASSLGNSTRLTAFNGVLSALQKTETRTHHLPPVKQIGPLSGNQCGRMAESKLT